MVKKRSPGDGGLYFVPKTGLWRGVVDVGFTPDGRRKQKAVSSRSQTAARRKLKDLMDEIAEHGAPIDKTTTVEQWAEHWLRTVCQPKLKPNGLAAYESITRTWIIPQLRRKKVALVKPSDVRAVTQAVMDAGKSSSTARKTFNILSGMLEAARLDGLTSKNVAKDVTPPKAAESNRRALTPAEADAMLRQSAELVDGTRWWSAILAGLRQAERLGLGIDDVDLDSRVIHVRWTLDEIPSEHGCGERDAVGAWPCGKKQGAACPSARLKVPAGFNYRRLAGRLCLVPPKSGKPRDVPIVAPLAIALQRYLEVSADWPNPHGLLWRHPDGSPILPFEDEQAWRDLLYACDIITEEQTKPPKDRAPGTADVPGGHAARHTTMTVMMNLGIDAKIIGEIVGHGTEKVTRGYQHVSSPIARDAMDRVGEHFAGALAGGTESDS